MAIQTEMCIKCTSVKEKKATQMVLLEAIRNKYKGERKELVFSDEDVKKVLVRTRVLGLNLSKEILKSNENDEFASYVNKTNLLNLIKDEITSRQFSTYKAAIIYPSSLINSLDHSFITEFLNKLFFREKNFPIFCFMSDHVKVFGYFENGETKVCVKSCEGIKTFYDYDDSLKNTSFFTRIVWKYLADIGCDKTITDEVINSLKVHSDMLKIVTRNKLAILLDYANETNEYDDIYHMCELLRSSSPIESWSHDVYELVSDFLTYDFLSDEKNDIIKDLIRKYFYDLNFLK